MTMLRSFASGFRRLLARRDMVRGGTTAASCDPFGKPVLTLADKHGKRMLVGQTAYRRGCEPAGGHRSIMIVEHDDAAVHRAKGHSVQQETSR